MVSKKILDLQEQFDIELNLLCAELDTSPQRLRYLSSNSVKAMYKDSFNSFCNIVTEKYPVVVSITEKADVYEVGDDCLVIVIYETSTDKYVIFDIQDVKKVEPLVLISDRQKNL